MVWGQCPQCKRADTRLIRANQTIQENWANQWCVFNHSIHEIKSLHSLSRKLYQGVQGLVADYQKCQTISKFVPVEFCTLVALSYKIQWSHSVHGSNLTAPALIGFRCPFAEECGMRILRDFPKLTFNHTVCRLSPFGWLWNSTPGLPPQRLCLWYVL